jgi:hypothetical protein
LRLGLKHVLLIASLIAISLSAFAARTPPSNSSPTRAVKSPPAKAQPKAQDQAATAFQDALSDPDRQRKMADRSALFGPELKLDVLQTVKVSDLQNNDLRTLEQFLRKAMTGSGAGAGEASVRCGFLYMLETDYLLNGIRIVADEQGKYLSVKDALRASNDRISSTTTERLQYACRSYEQMKTAYSRNDAKALTSASRDFFNAIDAASIRSPREALPIGDAHQAFWTRADARCARAIALFGEAYNALAYAFRRIGASDGVSAWLATMLVGAACLLVLLFLWSVPRFRLKRQIRRLEQEAAGYVLPNTVRASSGESELLRPAPDSRPQAYATLTEMTRGRTD